MVNRAILAFIGLTFVVSVNVSADSLFTAAHARAGTLISKENKFEVGDVITVIVQEVTDSSTSVVTNTKKESGVSSEAEANSNEFLIAEKPGGKNIMPKEQLPNWEIEAENEHKTRGEARRRSTLNTTVSCLVMEVGRNDLLRIEGSRSLLMNREATTLNVSGIIRARDVSTANTISSAQIANASITVKGKGPLWNSTRRGLITRFLDWVSPF